MSRWSVFVSPRRATTLVVSIAGLFAVVGSFGVRAEEQLVQVTPPSPPIADTKPAMPAKAAPAIAPEVAKGIRFPGETEVTTWIPESEGERLSKGEPVEVPGLGKVGADVIARSMMSGHAEPLKVKGIVLLRGRLVDVQGKPLRGEGIYRSPAFIMAQTSDPAFAEYGNIDPHTAAIADSQGRFAMIPPPRSWKPDQSVVLIIKTARGHNYEAAFVPVENKLVDVFLPTHLTPRVAPKRLVDAKWCAGIVVDQDGAPLEGVDVEAIEGMMPEFTARTDKQGGFRIRNLDKLRAGPEAVVPVRFRKAGYGTVRCLQQKLGMPAAVIALDNRTWIEGTVRGEDGKPLAGALVRANQGPKFDERAVYSELWSEANSDASGRYRLHLEPDEYSIDVRIPGKGSCRLPKRRIKRGEHQQRNIDLKRNVTFVATVVDSVTNKPVPNIRLANWAFPGVEGKSDTQGRISIPDMLPGHFEFHVEGKGYRRFWSQEGKHESSRYHADPVGFDPGHKWQQNFGEIDFDIQPPGLTAKILVERDVRIQGRVVDPDGKPVSGATVEASLIYAPLYERVESRADGTFEMSLPASGEARYHLVAHDGMPETWGKWANGISDSFKTKPGQVIKGMELRLKRPATIRGQVVDSEGHPVTKAKVTAISRDYKDSNYTTPESITDNQGRFELKLVRDGATYFQVTPQKPDYSQDIFHIVTVKEGESVNGVDVRMHPPMKEPAN